MSALLLCLLGRLPGYNDHPVVVRSLRRSSDSVRSAGQLLQQEELEESLLVRAAADGGATASRADWSKMAMVYLGQDRLYTFNQWSGDYGVWQYERKSLTKCDAFSWPPISTGRFEQLIGVEWIFLGFTRGQYLSQIIHLNPLTGSMALADCDESSFTADCENKQLSCKPLPLQNSVLPGRPGSVHELVYLGQDLLLHYERTKGRYALLNFTRCSHDGANDHDCALSAPIANGSLAPGEYHTYLGFDLVLSYTPRDGGHYAVLRLLRPGSGEEAAAAGGSPLVQVAAGHLSFERSWSANPARHRFSALREGQLLDYDKEEGNYRVLQLDPLDLAEGMVGELRYTALSGGAGKVPLDETDECSVHVTAASCLQAAQLGGRCGWCQAATLCRRGDARGPCARGNCQAPPEGCGLWHTPVARVYPDMGGAPRAVGPALPSPAPSPAAVGAVAAAGAAAGWLDMPMAVPPAFIAEGSALHNLAAFALRELQRRGCANSAEAGCAVLRDARLSRVAAASTLVSYASNASALTASDAHAFVAAHRGYSNASLTPTPAGDAAAAAAGVATVTHTLQLGVCTVDGGGGEDRLQLTVVDTVGGAELRLTAATIRVLTERLAGPDCLPLRLERSELDACSAPPHCWPAAGSCVAPAIAPPAFDSREFAYLGYDAVLDSAPVSGTLRIWQLDRRPTGAAPLLSPPLGTAVWGLPMRRFVFVGFDSWLDYSPGSGSYDLHRCDHERWQRGAPLLCARLCGGSCGTAADLTGDRQLVYLGHDRLLLFDTPSGQYSVLALRRAAQPRHRTAAVAAQLARLEAVEGVEAAVAPAQPAQPAQPSEAHGVGLGFASPLATGVVPEWAGRELVYMGDELLLATEPLSGAHSWWLLHHNSSSLVRRLVSEGVWESSPNGTRLLSLMEDRLLRTSPAHGGGHEYAYLQCVRPPCDAAGVPRGEVRCRTVGTGELHEGAGGVPASRRGVARVAGPRQQLLLEGGAAYSTTRPEGRQLLDYEARTGRVRILSIDLAPLLSSPLLPAAAGGNPFDPRGDAASRCDALPQPPLFSSAWPFENHRLIGLGNDTVLDLDPASGDYRVWVCRRAEFAAPAATPEPRAPGAAEPAAGADEPPPAPLPCDAVGVGQWTPLTRFSQLLWLGLSAGGPPGVAPLDTLLLWEPATAQYEVWRIRRTGRRWLPSAVARPLAAGTWEPLLAHSLVYLGGATLLALHPGSAAYEARLLDLGALYSSTLMTSEAQRLSGVPPPMETGLLAAGSLREVQGADGLGERCAGLGFHQPTALGDDLLLDLEPATGEYCVLRLSREQLSTSQPLTAVAAGNLLKRPCDHARCGECTAEPGCGWCSETARCMQGGALAPCGGGCTDHWMQGYCADWPCEHYSTCDDCLNTKLCGWCEGLQACMAGSDVQPLALTCPNGYAYQYCPASGSVDPISQRTPFA